LIRPAPFGNVTHMAECGHRAVLVVTRGVEGTSTSVARRRVELSCRLPAGHAGQHEDTEAHERWEGRPSQRPTILRHEEDEA
jgi:hypothetical protein